ncbi:hypothetical protein [Actinopolymorpha pittospori]|uniref:Uncharacterized protein n=1 Tax=Actinopolymorpha pittospori TaxID=648752 RepID=A0A927N612_9ACTN|nr:hypothetical protein [Actinopolymorpha pittospori]MBE1611633.1 hypothetical protein [Actinopolymorpha pittospori]
MTTPADPPVPEGSFRRPPAGGVPSAATGERWGWELRAPEVPTPTPFTDRPPGLPAVEAPWLTKLAGSRDRSAGGWWSHVRRVCALAVLGMATWLSTGFSSEYSRWVTAALAAGTAVVAYYTLRPVLLPWWGDLRYRRWQRSLVARQQSVLEETREWARRRAEHEQDRSAGVRPQHWEPLRPVTTHRVDVYGGDPSGAGSLLLSVAGSQLGSGTEVTVVDLSQDGICHDLVRQAGQEGRSVDAALLPDDLAAVDPLSGLTAEDVGTVVAEAVHVAERDRGPGGDRALDATLVEQICGCLRGPVTFTRLHASVRVVAHQEPCPPALSREEYDDLVDLLGEGARRSTEARLFRLAAALQRLAALESPALESGEQPGALVRPTDADLRVWELSERVGDLGGELLAHVLFQVLLHRLRHDERGGSRVLVVVGADRFRRTHIERLDQLARRRGVRLVLFFRHLREDAVDLLGGGEAVMFLRLGNAREAEQAASFIGRDHRLVLSQFTVSRSSSLSSTVGTSRTDSASRQESESSGRQWSRSRNYHYGALMDFPHDSGARTKGDQRTTTRGTSTSVSTGDSWSEQSGTSDSQSMGYQRVYEFSVEPTFLQALSPTAFVLVDPRDPGSPRLGDCGPEIDRMAGEGESLRRPDVPTGLADLQRLTGSQGTPGWEVGPEASAQVGPRTLPGLPGHAGGPGHPGRWGSAGVRGLPDVQRLTGGRPGPGRPGQARTGDTPARRPGPGDPGAH